MFTFKMAPKRKGKLQRLQEDTEQLERQVDSLMQRVEQLSDSTPPWQRRPDLQTAVTHTLTDLQTAVTHTLTDLQTADKVDELAPVGNYDQRKRAVEERLRALQKKLRALTIQPQDNSAKEEDSEEDEEHTVQDEDDEGPDRKGLSDHQSGVRYVTLSSFRGQEEGDLTVQKGAVVRILQKSDDGWWLARDFEGNEGLVPKNYLQKMSPHERVAESGVDDDDDDDEDSDEEQEDDNPPAEEKPSTSSNWDTARKAIDATDVLSVMGVIPPAFRSSTLSKLLEEGMSYRASHYIQPKLSQSELSFKDLQLDPNTGKVLSRHSRVCVTVTLWSCRMISPPGVGLSVLSRHVRLCAFNGTEMSSLLPCLLDGHCFFRCNSGSPDLIGILFELGVTYTRTSTGERGDLSCGWSFLKLFDENGALIPLRTQELAVNGGTPYEMAVDTCSMSSNRGGSTGALHQMLMSRKLPKLIIKLRSPNTRTREQLSLLPETLLGCVSTVPLLALYRQLLADTLLLDRVTMQNADLICSPVLATFPEVLDQTDLMDAFRKSWMESENNLKRSDKKDVAVLKRLFESVYLSCVFPLLFAVEMPTPLWANEDTESQRARLIYDSAHRIPLETMLSSNHKHQAFNMAQVSYDLLTSAWN